MLRLKKRFLPTCLALLGLIFAFTASINAQNNEKSLLWEVTGGNLKQPSYVFGTIHMIPKADFFLSDSAKAAINRSQKVVFEIDVKDMKNPLKLFGLMNRVMMSDNQTLRDLISAEDYALVERRFDSLGMPLKMFERMKPLFLSSMVDADGAQLDPKADEKTQKVVSYELEIMKIAEKQKKETGGLETMQFQVSIFDSIPYKVQADMLVKSVKETGTTGKNQFEELVKIYKSQDIDAMSAVIASESGTTDEAMSRFETMLILNRNKNWIEPMKKMMAKKPTFFAVGAGHLGGENGVVNLLRKEGFTLKPVF